MRANTSEGINGVKTATVMLKSSNALPVRQRAALVLHELFHVYECQHHPKWTANEAVLFTYPVDNAQAPALCRLETEALRRALASDGTAPASIESCWARVAVDVRAKRFAELPPDAVDYERGSELNEGLANYVQYTAAGQQPNLPAEEFPAAEVRQRFYEVGPAIDMLLDRLAPNWKERENASDVPIGDLLRDALSVNRTSSGCGFNWKDQNAAAERARVDVAQIETNRREAAKAFQAQSGWRVVIVAGAAPLALQGFDPLNVMRLGGNDILHKRFLRLGNDSGSLEVLNHGCVTEGVGPHPLFNGVKRLTIAGLTTKPEITSTKRNCLVRKPPCWLWQSVHFTKPSLTRWWKGLEKSAFTSRWQEMQRSGCLFANRNCLSVE